MNEVGCWVNERDGKQQFVDKRSGSGQWVDDDDGDDDNNDHGDAAMPFTLLSLLLCRDQMR